MRENAKILNNSFIHRITITTRPTEQSLVSDVPLKVRLFAFIHAFLISETERQKAIGKVLRKHESALLLPFFDDFVFE